MLSRMMRRGIKRALNIEETPFICTPKLNRTRSILTSEQKTSESTPPKRARLDLSGTPRTPKMGSFRVSEKLSTQMATLLDMPDVQSPECKLYTERAGTPHSILKTRRTDDMDREAPSPVDSRYLGDSDDELLETASNHTHYSDSTNKHLRFTIPTASESGSTPSPPTNSKPQQREKEMESSTLAAREKEMDVSIDSFVTTTSHAMTETHPMESPPKRLATEESVKGRKSFKDTVRARRSLSLSVNSSLSDDPNTSIESIADIPVTLINPRYSGEKRHYHSYNKEQEYEHTVVESVSESQMSEGMPEPSEVSREVPKTPRGRRGIRATGGESTPLRTSRNVTPERVDSPVATSLRGSRITRSRSRTPELSPRTSPLAPIPELPRREADSEPHPEKTTLSIPRRLRSRSRTPDRVDKAVSESPKLEAITESPTKSTNTESSSSSSPTRRSLRSRSRTPEIEVVQEIVSKPSPRSLRSRSKTPERVMSPKKESSARSKQAKASLSRKAFENILSAKVKQADKMDTETLEDAPETAIECTPMKTLKQVPNLMDVTLSPIVNKSILQSSTDSTLSETVVKEVKSDKSALETDLKPFPAFTTFHETCIEKSVLHSYQSSVAEITDTSINIREEKVVVEKSEVSVLKPLPAFTLNETEFDKSVLKSYQSSVADESSIQEEKEVQPDIDNNTSKPFAAFVQMIQTDFEKSVLRSAESSVAEASQLKDDSKAQEASSLMTNDSDADIEMEENVDNKKSAAEQKEKEKIVEIEREIDEIQDMSDEDDQDASESSGDEGEDEAESGSEASDDESEQIPNPENMEQSNSKDVPTNDGKICVTINASSTSNEGIEENDEVISIEDSDDSSDKLEIDEKSNEQNINNEPQNVDKDQIKDKETRQDEINNENATQVEGSDKFNQANFSLMTDDNSVASDKSDLNLNYSGESEKTNVSNEKAEAVEKEPIVQMEVESSKDQQPEPTPEPTKVDSTTQVDTPKETDIEIVEVEQKVTSEEAKESEKVENIPETVTEIVDEDVIEVPTVTKAPETTEQPEEKETAEEKTQEQSEEKEVEQQTRSRKRGKSTSSNKSVTEELVAVETEIKTPVTRKRTQSTASNKSVDAEQKTPESVKSEVTPSRRRAKTPTSAEIRKIITRRVSREMSERHDESKALDESVSTPKRRSNRSRSKNFDDNESVVSEGSVASIRSKASEDAGDRVRKGRKSVLATKPELSVIPEVTVEDGSKLESENVISEYSSARRLTRHQKAVLESWLEPQPHASPRRRLSTASRTSRTSHTSRSVASEADDDDASSTHSAAFDVQPIDRISLLNKTDFEGSTDLDELQTNLSPESLASDASKQRRARLGRAASETKVTPRAAKINRRISVDVADSPDPASPVPMGGESPARGRRKSFNRACEALHTPKGRRTSTDLRKGDVESPVESPAASESEAVTPARRTRRTASTMSKKTVLDESKDTKKK
ncbi:hypothetical protein SFRURICE_002820 [Spodoptera frugiperda]|nr:hypothetical protein SFRURICE_002820 [Spodoptera frugiperda]